MLKNALSLLAVLCLLAATAQAAENDVQTLLNGVAEIGAPGLPGSLSVFGDGAFPVVTGKSGNAQEPVVAAAQTGNGAGAGRIVAFGHDGYLGPDNLKAADTGRLLLNAIRWAGRGANPGRVMVYKQDGLTAWLKAQGLDAETGNPDKIGAARVFIASAHDINKAQGEQVAKFVNAGGGFITAATGWGWEQVTGRDIATQFPANDLLAPWGLVFTGGTLDRTTKNGFAATPPPSLAHAGRALDAAKAQIDGAQKLAPAAAAQVSTILGRAATALPPDDKILLPRLHQLTRQNTEAVVPTHQHPIKKDDLAGRLLLTLQINELKKLPADEVKAHPAGAVFPGAVPADAKAGTRPVAIDTTVPGWHSLGLYAAPGALIVVNIPENAAKKGLAVRIGCHSDGLWGLDRWQRAPEITRVVPLSGAVTRAANAFGGLVYIVVPDDAKLGTIEAKISGAVEAPLFVRGKTDLNEWRTTIRNAPGPWAELASDKIVLSVPSGVVRSLDDPASLMKYWDDGMDAVADLATIPHRRKRPERIVADEQISAGYMHSGYPIMTFLDVTELVVDLPKLMKGDWGHWHEMGHNHQVGDWTFGGTGEVTNNLFSLYVNEKVAGVPEGRAHPNVQVEWQQKALKKYLADGASFEKWQNDPFLALLMYIQLQREFGWDAYKKVFAAYRTLPNKERPQSDDDKRDQWLVRFSKTVGRNLGPFFQAWGVPTSDKARASIADLPGWMPADWPKP